MSDAAPSPEPLPDQLDDNACQRALSVILRVGTALLEELEKPSDNVTLAARAQAFDRIALAVRRTVLLSRHLREKPLEAVSQEARRIVLRKEIIRAVEDKIDLKADPAEAPNLRLELLERIDSPDFEADLRLCPPGELIKQICQDLGLAQIPYSKSFPRRTPDDIAILCAQAAAPSGSGLPQWSAVAFQRGRDSPDVDDDPDDDSGDAPAGRHH